MTDAVTIVDLARELKISPSTVSRALRDHPAIKEETKLAVQELAKKLGYQPNTSALNLLYKKTNNIGVIVPEITSFFFSSIICGIQDVLEPAGQHIFISQSNESKDLELKGIETFLSARVDGVLISSSLNSNDFANLERLRSAGIPTVVFDRDCEGFEIDKVLVDDYDGACQAVKHLINTGCKRIAHIAGPDKLSIARHRKNGYLDTLTGNGITPDEDLLVNSRFFQMEDGIEPTKRLLDLPHPPDAIFAVNDAVAIGSLSVLRERGVKIPDDLAIVGFDNNPFSAFASPGLSTVDQPVYEMGMLSARILLNHLKKANKEPGFRHEILKPELIVRQSSLVK